MQDRLPPIPTESWSEAQAIIDGPRGALISPFVPLLRSPELMGHVQRLGEYLRYRSAIGLRLSELAILVVARSWSQPVEWAIHAPIALREGIATDTVQAISEGRRLAQMPADEAAVHDFCVELHRQQRVSDGAWAAVVALAGEQGAVDLLGLIGYYSLLAMVMNAAGTPVPASSMPPPQPLTST